jgi:phosphoribosylformimino-5-aminoimidazole carboxamide ribotide isomerase
MLIPSIDLMGGKIVQLVQGRKKALEFDNFDEWIVRFSKFPLVQLIDLDAAIGSGDNRAILDRFTQNLPCQVGGGIRSIKDAKALIALGARKVIIGSTLVKEGRINTAFAEELSKELDQNLVFAVDAKEGKVSIRGWREATILTPAEMIEALDPYCSAFLYTHIDTEGLMQGIPLDVVRLLRSKATKQLIVAGGISSQAEIDELDAMGADAVVGMALYLGKLNLEPNQNSHQST